MYRPTHIHFVGIGGIGMSGIAYMLKKMGYSVSGCDIAHNSSTIEFMASCGINISQGHDTPACNNPAIDYVVYSSSVVRSSPELQRAEQRGVLLHRSHMLAELMRPKYGIAISGSHGKTTTSALIAHIFTSTGLDPSYVVGGYLQENGSNAQYGTGKFFIAEADESDRSLLNLTYSIAVVTNISKEHLDMYQDIDDICTTFKQFLHQLPFYGKAIICIDDYHASTLCSELPTRSITYGLSHAADFCAQDVTLLPHHSTFSLSIKQQISDYNVHVPIPGAHNVLNTLAAIAVAHEAEIPLQDTLGAIRTFQGVQRRFSFRGTLYGAEIFDDYGHHPREIACTLAVARKKTKNKLIVIFQPHRFTRTQALWDDFVALFSQQPIDHLFITDIYSAHEDPLPSITSYNLVQAIQRQNPLATVAHLDTINDATLLKHKLLSCVQPDDLILLLGAGSIYSIGHTLIESEKEQ